MKSVVIKLSLAENVKQFVNVVSAYPYDMDLRAGRHVVDAKSILGIFSLDLSKPITLEVYADNCDDLLEALREKNYLSPDELEYAIFETNGDVSVIPKACNRPVTAGDLALQTSEAKLPYAVICEGKKMSENVRKGNIDYSRVEKILQNHNLKQKNVLLMTVTGGKNYYLQPISGRYVTGSLEEENVG